MQIFADKVFENPIEIIKAFDKDSFVKAFSRIEELRKNYYLLGYIRYEAKEIFFGNEIESDLPLLYFEVFENYRHCEEEQGSDAAIQEKPLDCFTFARNDMRALINYGVYESAINKIKEEISCGNTYQVNYTYEYEVKTDLDGLDFYNSILPNQTTPYNSYIKNEWEEILCFSPELFFEIEGSNIRTKPMKGTVKRGKNEQEDKDNIEFLKNDTKNRAENVMIVDLLRNDLGKIAKTATVKVDKLFEIETHKTVHQMTSEISAELEEGKTLYEIFEAIFPCGSVTGAPKINTMKIIDELEVGKRGVYCGAIGLISPEKTVFSVPIRTLQGKNGKGGSYSCRVGGGIVWDSTAEEEWEETLTKIKFLNPFSCHSEPSEESQSHRCFANTQHDEIDFQIVETILVEDGQLKYEEEHFNRMEKSATELKFEFDLKKAKCKIQSSVGRDCHPAAILRILLNKNGSCEIQQLPMDEIKTNKVTVSKLAVNSKEPLLYHKTNYRPWYNQAMEKIRQGLIFDEIFFNERGELTEGARSNIVLQIDGELFTPPVECGLLNGVLRQEMLKCNFIHPSPNFSYSREQVFSNRKMPSPPRGEGCVSFNKIQEKILYLDDLEIVQKIFCINSIRRIIEVRLNVDNSSPRPLGETKRTTEKIFEGSEPVGAGTSERDGFQNEGRILEIQGEG